MAINSIVYVADMINSDVLIIYLMVFSMSDKDQNELFFRNIPYRLQNFKNGNIIRQCYTVKIAHLMNLGSYHANIKTYQSRPFHQTTITVTKYLVQVKPLELGFDSGLSYGKRFFKISKYTLHHFPLLIFTTLFSPAQY